jgi:thiol-disulfide isomerase/thioredoxin
VLTEGDMRLGLTLLPVLFAAGMAVSPGRAAADRPHDCEASPQTRRELTRLDARIESFNSIKLRAMKLARLEELLKRRPDDVFLHLDYQATAQGRTAAERNQVVERYKRLAESHSGSFEYNYLYAASLVDTNTPEAISRLKQILSVNSNYPLAHLELARIYQWGKFADHTEMNSQLNEYYDACPASFDERAIFMLLRAAPAEMALKYSAQLRARLERGREPEMVTGWETVWNLEFKGNPPAQHDQVRKRLAMDLEGLRKRPHEKDVAWWSTLQAGYKMAGNEAERRRFEDRIVADFPETYKAKRILAERWEKDHPFPDPDDTAAANAYWTAATQKSDEQLKKKPDDVEELVSRFIALSKLDDATPEQIDSAGEAVREAIRDNPDLGSFEFDIAGEYLKRKIRVEETPTLVEEGWTNHKQRVPFLSDRDEETKKYQAQSEIYTRIERARLLVNAAEKLKKPQIAKSAVDDLADLKPEKPKQQASLLAVKAEWAELNGRKLDALLLYRDVLDARPPDFKPPRNEPDEIPERYDRLWRELGGTEEGKAILAKKAKAVEVASAGDWEKPTKKMPAWELPDLSGKTWKLASLQGKTVLINLWATWCEFCKLEHPHLEKLYEKMKERTDIQIITFDVDDEIGGVEPYIQENKYTFPVLLAKDLVWDLIPDGLGIPQNWIVDGSGKWRWQQVGFGMDDAQEWGKKLVERLEQTKP